MTGEPNRAGETYFDVSEDEVDRSIALCGGDVRETVRRLLIGQAYLERRISGLAAEASRGYGRGRTRPLAQSSDAGEAR